MELPGVRCLGHPLTRHVSRAVLGTGGHRCRSNTKFIEWWHAGLRSRSRSRSRSESVILGGVGVGVGVDEILPTPTPACMCWWQHCLPISHEHFFMSASTSDCQKNSFDDFGIMFTSLPIHHPPFNNDSVNKFSYQGVTIILTSQWFVKTDWMITFFDWVRST